ncbi:MAG: DNA-directed RNA polymerase subunit beta, partial [Thermodesulfobacteriota bacterium]
MINGSRGTTRLRKSFGKIPEIIDIPNLIEVQKKSYQLFLQLDVPPESRKNMGLQGVLNSVFPIWDFNRTASLEFKSYSLGEPKYSVVACRQRGMTYSAPLKVVVQLVVWDVDELGESRAVRDVKEQEVYFGELPLMTENGTFVVNGTERVIVSQLHRSPGVFFDHDKSRSQASGKLLYSARIIPYRGSWLDFEFDHKDLVYVRIDRRRSLLVTTLFRAMGCTDQEMLDYFFRTESILVKEGKFFKSSAGAQLVGQRFSMDFVDPKNKEVILRAGRRVTKLVVKRMQEAGLDKVPVSLGELVGEIVARPELSRQTGEVILECNEELTLEKLKEIAQDKLDKFEIIFINQITAGSYIRDTLAADKTKTREEALIEIYRRLRPGDPSTPEMAVMIFEGLFSRPERYDLSPVGRLKLNYKLKLQFPLSVTTLQKEDILATVRYLVGLKNGQGEVDDIDHLGNRRVRTVGELLENQYRVGLARMERAIKERLSLQDVETMMPYDLVNPKPVTAVVKEFFGSSQLSQFMDQTNPLSEITHKRRLSALGPGGLTRERAGFEVRDVHPTHYGRICPIETPEGPNIGLIASLSTYARINEFGFIETPYREAADGKVTNKIRFLTAMEEQDRVIAQANAPLDNRNRFIHELISCRRGGEFIMARREDVNFMDVSPKQLVSVAASLIPFLEHDDANRALMGANMQRQAVPLLKTEAPLIGTGMEGVAARDSGAVILAKHSGTVESMDASRIVIKADG